MRVLEIAARVARRVFDGDVSRLCDFLGTKAGEVPWVSMDPGEPAVVVSRLDAFLTPAGQRGAAARSSARLCLGPNRSTTSCQPGAKLSPTIQGPSGRPDDRRSASRI